MKHVALAALAAALAACGPSSEPAGAPAPPEPAPAVSEPPATPGAVGEGADRPATTTATVRVEGMEEPISLRLARFPGVPLPFSTYLPEGWAAETASSGEGTAVRLTMGEPPLQGFVSLFVPQGATAPETVALARSLAEGRGGAREPEGLPPWAEAGFAFASGAEVGTVWVGEHAGTPFYVLEAYPVEMGDGFAPRAALVLDRLRWLDTGGGL
jgi:hypothetical protein